MKAGSIVVLACAVIAVCAAPAIATAQTLEFTPHFGMHVPVGLLMEGVDQTDNSFIKRRQLGATSIGARVSLRTAGAFIFESSATYSPSLVAITDRDRTVDLHGRVFMGNLKALVRLHGERRGPWSFYAGPGMGVVHRHGEGWAGTKGLTDAALVLAGRARLGQLKSNKAFIFTVEDYVTRAAFAGTTEQSEPRIHHDVVYSFGMSFPLTR